MAGRLAALLHRPGLRRMVVASVILALGLWFLFLDSHSLFKRLQYAAERNHLRSEVVRLQEANAELEAQVAAGLTEEIVEKVAREQYGMRRPGETVYPLEYLTP
jgi:cell division protein FtsB